MFTNQPPLAVFYNIIISISLLTLLACGESGEKKSQKNTEVKKETSSINQESNEKIVLFFGNSLTAGYGIDPDKAFAGLIQEKIKTAKLPYKVVNAGLSGETTAGGKERVKWILRQKIDVFILELGGNDALRGIDPASSYENLKAIIEEVRSTYPAAKIVLAGMEAPPNLGEEYTTSFRENYRRLSKEYALPLIPFLLDGVAGQPELNLEDGIHPTVEGHVIVAENVWAILESVLKN